MEGVITPHQDALVMIIEIAKFHIARCLVDRGSLVNVIWTNALTKMGLGGATLKPIKSVLFGFIGEVMHLWGKITLLVALGMGKIRKTRYV